MTCDPFVKGLVIFKMPDGKISNFLDVLVLDFIEPFANNFSTDFVLIGFSETLFDINDTKKGRLPA